MKSVIFVQRRFMSRINYKKNKFIDSLRVHVRGGAGGQGLPRHGGVGGQGGNVVFVADKNTNMKDVIAVSKDTKRFTASCGQNSMRKVLMGQPGNDKVIKVPVGVCVETDEGSQIADLNEDGQAAVVASGGEGGNRMNNFLGRKGEARSVKLDLKLIADIGLVGFPNAGKSTFLKSVSRTLPKIAEYPFTTIRPQLGTMMYKDSRRITVADLPGLIEGAHINVGMGHKFLKHVERTKMLLFVVDVTGFQLNRDCELRSAFETILLLNKEIELYNPELLKKPAVLALNKMDLDKDGKMTEEVLEQFCALPASLKTVPEEIRPNTLITFDEHFKMSAMFDEKMDKIKIRLKQLLDSYADKLEEDDVEHMQHMRRLQQLKGLLGKEKHTSNLI